MSEDVEHSQINALISSADDVPSDVQKFAGSVQEIDSSPLKSPIFSFRNSKADHT